ncbi:MAG: peptidyl-Lys metalloendopeptidase domain protein [Pseudomonadota bacterium]|jgi:hypothetical protein
MKSQYRLPIFVLVGALLMNSNLVMANSDISCKKLNVELRQDQAKGKVILVYINQSDTSIAIPKWYLGHPDNGKIEHDMLFVKNRNGKKMPYFGDLVKRGEPRSEDLIELKAHETINSVVDIVTSYARSSGIYYVSYDAYAQFDLLVNDKNKIGCFQKLTSQEVRVAL